MCEDPTSCEVRAALETEKSITAVKKRLFGQDTKEASERLMRLVHNYGLWFLVERLRSGLTKGSNVQNKYKPEDVLVKHAGPRNNASVRRVIAEHNLLPYVCSECGQGEIWRGKRISLDLDHIDGDYTNDELSNLRFLCGNCHKATETYCNKNRQFTRSTFFCKRCAAPVSRSHVDLCRLCSSNDAALPRRKFEVTKDELERLIPLHTYEEIAAMFGVGSTAIRKRAAKLGCPLPRRKGEPRLNFREPKEIRNDQKEQ